MKCVTCERTLSAGGSSHPMSADGIEAVFADLLGWAEVNNGWRCADCIASADTRPEGGDATEIAAPFTSGAVGEAETPKGGSHA